jgi:hypothetical protein
MWRSAMANQAVIAPVSSASWKDRASRTFRLRWPGSPFVAHGLLTFEYTEVISL